MIVGIDGRPAERSASRCRGVGIYTRFLCEALIEKNRAVGQSHQFVLASLRPGAWRGRFDDQPGARVRPVLAIRKPSRLQWVLDWWALPRFLQDNDIDIFHATEFASIPSAPRTNVIAHVHDMIPFIFWNEYAARIPADFRWALQRARRRMLGVDLIITDSHHSKNDIEQMTGYPEKQIRVVYLGPGIAGMWNEDQLWNADCEMRNDEKLWNADRRMRNEESRKSNVESRKSNGERQPGRKPTDQQVGGSAGPQVGKSAGQQVNVPHSAFGIPQSEVTLPPFFGHQAGEDYPYFLYVGGTDFRKNVPYLIRAFDAFSRKRTDAKLLLVGETFLMRNLPEVGEIYEEIRRRGLNNRVQATGFVNEKLLQLLYRRAVALVFPSLYEGFGVPVLEAMALGTPVLAARTSSIPEVLGNTGLYFGPRDQDSLVAAMERIYDDASLRQDLSARAKQRSQQFSWQKAAEQIFQIYEELE